TSVSDDAAPVTGTVANGGFTNDTTPTLAGTAEANSTVTIFDGASQLGTVLANGSGAWTFTTAALGQGGHSFTATATDAAGNTGAASSAYSLSIDTGAPAAPTITSVSDDAAPVTGTVANGGFTNDITPTLAGTAEANSTVTIFDGASQLGTVLANGSGAWTFTTAALGQGGHSFTATATDAAGNTGAASSAYSLSIDTGAPAAPTITSVSDDAAPVTGTVANGGFTNDITPTLAGTAEANSTVTIFDGASQLGTVLANGSGAWTFTTAALGQGGHSFTATATDAAGNTGAASSAYSLSIDTTAPAEALAITAIATDSGTVGDFITNDTSLIVSGSNGALATGEKIQVSSNGGTTWTDVAQTTATSWSLDDTANPHGTSFTYQARIVDSAGNVGTTASQAITIDTGPVIINGTAA